MKNVNNNSLNTGPLLFGDFNGNSGVTVPCTYSSLNSPSAQADTSLVWSTPYNGAVPSNLMAVADGNAAAATINQLRLAFQIQKFYERQARGGSRYTEVVRSFFGVTSPDARLQRPEYLGGNRVPININQIVQQSGTESSGTPQGTVVGQSLTTDKHSDFTKSFTEHGLILSLIHI